MVKISFAVTQLANGSLEAPSSHPWGGKERLQLGAEVVQNCYLCVKSQAEGYSWDPQVWEIQPSLHQQTWVQANLARAEHHHLELRGPSATSPEQRPLPSKTL